MRLNNTFIRIAAFVPITLLSGCATKQAAINFSQESLAGKNEVIGVAASAVPGISVDFPGADCLLCLAAAYAANSDMRTHAKSVTTTELASLQDSMVNKLKSKGYKVVKIDDPIVLHKLPSNSSRKEGYAKYNFTGYSKQNITSLVVLNYKTVGFRRNYQAYFPVGPMKAAATGEAYMVSLVDNKLLWHKDFDVIKGVTGDWNNPPKFPELTNSYYAMIEELKDSIIDGF